MDPLTIAALGSVAIGGISSIYNTWSQKRENETTREREDNAVQRRYNDLVSAGLSPTLAAGSPASAVGQPAPKHDAYDYLSKALQMYQGRADIAQTNSQTALNDMLATSERFKQAFTVAETKGVDLRNNWINADMMSKIGLRDSQGKKIGEEIKNIIADTSLLNAKTAYEQANRDFIMTQNDNEKTKGLLLRKDLEWSDRMNESRVFNLSGGNKLPYGIGGAFGIGEILQHWWDNRNK